MNASVRIGGAISRVVTPWWIRIGAKVMLSRLPLSYAMWRSLNVFVHGQMGRPEYVLGVFRRHFATAEMSNRGHFVALELGPGDSLGSVLIAQAHGAKFTYLVDAGEFATEDMQVYRELGRYLRSEGLESPDLDRVRNVAEMLKSCAGSYLSAGVESLRQVPTESVDFIWSHAVLEHVRREQVRDVMLETRRILRSGGICSHRIDLTDHLGGSLNNLRIPTRWWEKDWMARSGFYTNRLRKCDFIAIFEEAGFVVEVVSVDRWKSVPIKRDLLAREFRSLSDDELTVKAISVLLRPMEKWRREARG
ncbi:MAG: methyltransferase domain-containing protein [Chloroflexota bacterium]